MKYRKYFFNENFFKEDTTTSNYWAGFIAADGCVQADRCSLSICLSAKDKDHLESFNNALQSTYKVKDRVMSGKYDCCELSIYSKIVVQDLLDKYLVTPKKSLTLKYPKFESHLMEDSFIRGYIDGDGCINKKVSTISILGTLDFLNGIANRFEQIITKRTFVIRKKHKGSNIHDLRVYGDSAKEIFKWFNELPTPYLKRKWHREDEVFEFYKDKTELQLKFVAPQLGVSVITLKRWHKKGKFKALKRNGFYYYTKEMIEDFKASNHSNGKFKRFIHSREIHESS